MFDLVFNGMAAFQQAGMLLAGVMCFVIGAIVLGNGLYWRIKAAHVNGTITGIRQNGGFYYPVYRYILPSGEERESTSTTGVSSPRGMDTGRTLRLLVFPDKPEEARPAGSVLYLVIGLFFLGPGALFVWLALHSFPVNGFTFGMLGIFAAVGAYKVHKHIIPKNQRGTIAEWRAKRQAEHDKEWASATTTTLEAYRDSPDGMKAAGIERKQARIAMPVLIIIGCAMMWGAWHFGGKMADLTEHGARVQGRVVDMVESSSDSDGNTSYHPVVEFTDGKGRTQKFQDSIGSSPPSYRIGDDVKVLYLPERPDAATIDRGWMNWLLPCILGGFGFGAVLLGLSMARYRDGAA